MRDAVSTTPGFQWRWFATKTIEKGIENENLESDRKTMNLENRQKAMINKLQLLKNDI